jgi:hypothetical protein
MSSLRKVTIPKLSFDSLNAKKTNSNNFQFYTEPSITSEGKENPKSVSTMLLSTSKDDVSPKSSSILLNSDLQSLESQFISITGAP